MDPNAQSENKIQAESSSSDDEENEETKIDASLPTDQNNQNSEFDLITPRTKVIMEVRARRKTYTGYTPQGTVNISPELLLRIFCYMEPFQLCKMCLVSKAFRLVASDFTLWHEMYLLRWKATRRISIIHGEVNWKRLFRDRYTREKIKKDPLSLRPAWIPDSEAPQCTICLAPFTVIKRRHHCRNCGAVYCKSCCSKKMQLPALLYNKPVRVCDKCHLKLQKPDSSEKVSSGSLKLVVLGQSGVGKTVLINKFILGSFAENSVPTIGANFLAKTMMSAEGKAVKLQIWDTAGAEKYYGMVKMYYAGASACLIVFDPRQPNALAIPEMWIQKINQEESRSIVFALASTKCDSTEKVVVTEQEIEQFMNKYQIDIYVETSAKNNYNIDELFQEIVETIITRFDVQ